MHIFCARYREGAIYLVQAELLLSLLLVLYFRLQLLFNIPFEEELVDDGIRVRQARGSSDLLKIILQRTKNFFCDTIFTTTKTEQQIKSRKKKKKPSQMKKKMKEPRNGAISAQVRLSGS